MPSREYPELDEYMEYYLTLGTFVERFALVESELHACVVRTAGVDFRVGQAILSGTRIDTDIQYLRRLYEAKSMPMPKALQQALEQLAVINNLRNLLLHNRTRNWHDAEGGGSPRRTVSNAARAFRAGAIQEHDLSIELLKCAEEDLGVITITFWCVRSPTKDEYWDPDALMQEYERRPWLYKARPKRPRDPAFDQF